MPVPPLETDKVPLQPTVIEVDVIKDPDEHQPNVRVTLVS